MLRVPYWGTPHRRVLFFISVLTVCSECHYHGYVSKGCRCDNRFTQSLTSNGRCCLTICCLGSDVSLCIWFNCHTAPSLRLFVPNSPTVCHRSLLSEVPACDVAVLGCSGFSFFPPRCSLSNKCHRSLLTYDGPERQPISFRPFLQRFFVFFSQTVGSVPLRYGFPLYPPFLFPFRKGSTPLQYPIHHSL
jgi:hypothetical protein